LLPNGQTVVHRLTWSVVGERAHVNRRQEGVREDVDG